ncbi:receptor for activated protein kinase C [Culex quinquefasciatus]|uniref:Receptor for activated protein kinase C n=1 Tax=Culex quinquefasciatus TaxID=7176 RepID=B0WJD8_CULQU|nr:receptor for activated protein kinase C [Culex quinquefasciatus]|eukprot:XP_001848822.1 receptor for activated protein kinase C [Culex quinquefasciatus]
MTEMLQLCGQLVGHSGCGTLIAANPKYTDMVLSSSPDKSSTLSSDGNYALSDAWEKTLHL